MRQHREALEKWQFDMSLEAVAEWLVNETGIRIMPGSATAVTGGYTHETHLVDRVDGGTVFLKINRDASLRIFEAEQLGLNRACPKSSIFRSPFV